MARKTSVEVAAQAAHKSVDKLRDAIEATQTSTSSQTAVRRSPVPPAETPGKETVDATPKTPPRKRTTKSAPATEPGVIVLDNVSGADNLQIAQPGTQFAGPLANTIVENTETVPATTLVATQQNPVETKPPEAPVVQTPPNTLRQPDPMQKLEPPILNTGPVPEASTSVEDLLAMEPLPNPDPVETPPANATTSTETPHPAPDPTPTPTPPPAPEPVKEKWVWAKKTRDGLKRFFASVWSWIVWIFTFKWLRRRKAAVATTTTPPVPPTPPEQSSPHGEPVPLVVEKKCGLGFFGFTARLLMTCIVLAIATLVFLAVYEKGKARGWFAATTQSLVNPATVPTQPVGPATQEKSTTRPVTDEDIRKLEREAERNIANAHKSLRKIADAHMNKSPSTQPKFHRKEYNIQVDGQMPTDPIYIFQKYAGDPDWTVNEQVVTAPGGQVYAIAVKHIPQLALRPVEFQQYIKSRGKNSTLITMFVATDTPSGETRYVFDKEKFTQNLLFKPHEIETGILAPTSVEKDGLRFFGEDGEPEYEFEYDAPVYSRGKVVPGEKRRVKLGVGQFALSLRPMEFHRERLRNPRSKI